MIVSQGDPEIYLKRHCFIDLYVFIISTYIHISLFFTKCVFDKIFVLNNTHQTAMDYLPDNNTRNENVMKYFLPVILNIQMKRNC